MYAFVKNHTDLLYKLLCEKTSFCPMQCFNENILLEEKQKC